MESSKKIIVLTGMKHSGKSTVGKILAGMLNMPFLDTDDVAAAMAGKPVRQLYAEGGASLMQHWEAAACREACTRLETGGILATGGGISDNSEALALVQAAGILVFLDTPLELVYKRVLHSAERDGVMPAFLQGDDPAGKFAELFSRRTEIYARMAQIRIATAGLSPKQVATTLAGSVQT